MHLPWKRHKPDQPPRSDAPVIHLLTCRRCGETIRVHAWGEDATHPPGLPDLCQSCTKQRLISDYDATHPGRAGPPTPR